MFGAVFGLSSVLGPLLGALITDSISWHWVFYINVPIGILSLFFILRYYKESLEHKKQKIDWAGAITLVVSIVGLMFALELGGKTYDWNSVQIIGLFAVFAVFFIAFLLWKEKRKNRLSHFGCLKPFICYGTDSGVPLRSHVRHFSGVYPDLRSGCVRKHRDKRGLYFDADDDRFCYRKYDRRNFPDKSAVPHFNADFRGRFLYRNAAAFQYDTGYGAYDADGIHADLRIRRRL